VKGEGMNPTHNSKFIIHNSDNDPLHGVTLKMIVTRLVELHGWEELGRLIEIRCFTHDPSVSSSLKFLRRTPWARDKVEELYLRDILVEDGEPRAGRHE
jgi:uncharacterized protein (DUF2132 family)